MYFILTPRRLVTHQWTVTEECKEDLTSFQAPTPIPQANYKSVTHTHTYILNACTYMCMCFVSGWMTEVLLSWKVKVKSLSRFWLFATPWTIQPSGLLCPWDSPGKNAGVGCHFLLQGIFPTQGSNPGFPQADALTSEPPGKLCLLHV